MKSVLFPHTVPGTLPNLLARGAPASWAGPLRHAVLVTEIRTLTGEQTAYVLDGAAPQKCTFADLVLDLSQWTGRALAARWLAEQGKPTWWALDTIGALTPTQSAEVLTCSVRRVAVGVCPVVKVEQVLPFPNTRAACGSFAGRNYRWAAGFLDGIHDWRVFGYACLQCAACGVVRPGLGALYAELWAQSPVGAEGPRPVVAMDSTCVGSVFENNLGWRWGVAEGPETGDAAIAKLHEGALSEGVALLFPDGSIQCPECPDGLG